jgi:hypothetical protein
MSKLLGGIAAETYAQGSGGEDIQSLIPRSKFQFRVSITHLSSESVSGLITSNLTRISSIDMPSHTMNTNVLNQYNKKRIVQTGLTYNPIQLVAYDTRDAEIETFLKTYTQYYYTGLMSTISQKFTNDVINENFYANFSATGMKLQQDRYFIKQLDITRTSSADDINVITIYNPIITSVRTDTLDYSDSSPVKYTLEIAYEGYHIRTIDKNEFNTDTAPTNRTQTTSQNTQTIPQKGSTQLREETRSESRPTTREDIVDFDGQIRESVVTNDGVKRLTKDEIIQGRRDGTIKRSIANTKIREIENKEKYLEQLDD